MQICNLEEPKHLNISITIKTRYIMSDKVAQSTVLQKY